MEGLCARHAPSRPRRRSTASPGPALGEGRGDTGRWQTPTARHVSRALGEPSTVRPSDVTRVGQGGPRTGPGGVRTNHVLSGPAHSFTDAEAGAQTGDGHPEVTRRAGPGQASLSPTRARGCTSPGLHCLSGPCPGPVPLDHMARDPGRPLCQREVADGEPSTRGWSSSAVSP